MKPKFAALHKLMDGLNKVTQELETLQPHLKTLQESPQRRKQIDATSEEVYAQVNFEDLDDMIEDVREELQRSVLFTPFNCLMAVVILASFYMQSLINKHMKNH